MAIHDSMCCCQEELEAQRLACRALVEVQGLNQAWLALQGLLAVLGPAHLQMLAG